MAGKISETQLWQNLLLKNLQKSKNSSKACWQGVGNMERRWSKMGRGTGLVPTSSRKEQAKGQADVLHPGTETGIQSCLLYGWILLWRHRISFQKSIGESGGGVARGVSHDTAIKSCKATEEKKRQLKPWWLRILGSGFKSPASWESLTPRWISITLDIPSVCRSWNS